ncbi:putative adenylate cyclase [Ixodes scapularis]
MEIGDKTLILLVVYKIRITGRGHDLLLLFYNNLPDDSRFNRKRCSPYRPRKLQATTERVAHKTGYNHRSGVLERVLPSTQGLLPGATDPAALWAPPKIRGLPQRGARSPNGDSKKTPPTLSAMTAASSAASGGRALRRGAQPGTPVSLLLL